MNISLTPELEKMISDKIASGRYHSASEVVREALRLLKQLQVPENMAREFRKFWHYR